MQVVGACRKVPIPAFIELGLAFFPLCPKHLALGLDTVGAEEAEAQTRLRLTVRSAILTSVCARSFQDSLQHWMWDFCSVSSILMWLWEKGFGEEGIFFIGGQTLTEKHPL